MTERGKNKMKDRQIRNKAKGRLNRERVMEAYMRLLFERKKRPTHQQLAEDTGLSERTISRHLQKLRFEKNLQEVYKQKTDEVIQALLESAKKGKAAEVKLWLQFIEQWSESTNINHSGEVQVSKINFIEAKPKKGDDEDR